MVDAINAMAAEPVTVGDPHCFKATVIVTSKDMMGLLTPEQAQTVPTQKITYNKMNVCLGGDDVITIDGDPLFKSVADKDKSLVDFDVDYDGVPDYLYSVENSILTPEEVAGVAVQYASIDPENAAIFAKRAGTFISGESANVELCQKLAQKDPSVNRSDLYAIPSVKDVNEDGIQDMVLDVYMKQSFLGLDYLWPDTSVATMYFLGAKK